MMKNLRFLIVLISFCLSCSSNEQNSDLIAFEVYCEMVANDAKPIALHHPLEGKKVDQLWNDFTSIAKKYEVKLYREDELPVTTLFPADATKDKSVVLIYRGDRLAQYEQLKKDIEQSIQKGSEEQESLARRFGRLLGYSPQGINELLSENSAYRNLAQAKVQRQVTHLYYTDLDQAIDFYSEIVGLDQIDSSEFKIGDGVTLKLHSTNADHSEGQSKSTAIAFLTDQLPAWYSYLQEKEVPIKYTYKPRDGGPHDGFVALDPEGYLLEFEQFKQHPENELFMATLEQAPRLKTSINDLNFYGSITWTYHKDLLKMQSFYEEVLGFQLVADQGWTKIYQTSSSGFIGLVDERRGMENYADSKAVELEWTIENFNMIDEYALDYWGDYKYSSGTIVAPEKYIYHITQ